MHRLLYLLLLAPSAFGQDLLVAKHTPARIALHSGVDGALLNDTFIDIDALLSLAGGNRLHWHALVAPNGEIWVSSFTSQTIHRFSGDGSAYIGNFVTAPGSAVGMTFSGGNLWCAATAGPFGAGVVEYDGATLAQVSNVAVPSVWGAFAYNGEILMTQSTGSIQRIDPATGMNVGVFSTPGGFLEQMALAPNGELLVANFTPAGFKVLDPMGAVLQTYSVPSVGGPRGIAPLANGELLLSGSVGVFSYNAQTGVSTPRDGGGSGSFISSAGASLIASNYCTTTLNSTGASAEISGTGSNLVGDNNVTLLASDLPLNQFGFFLTSRTQGFVATPGGSQGNLCLGGTIGRYVAPGQIQNAGANGALTLALDLTRTPEGPAFVAIQAGETWNFQTWFRDVGPGGAPWSNFTNGLSVSFQ